MSDHRGLDPSFGTEKMAMDPHRHAGHDRSVTPDELELDRGRSRKGRSEGRLHGGESVGPKVSGELIATAAHAAGAATTPSCSFWLRFEWQFALGAVVWIVHDVL